MVRSVIVPWQEHGELAQVYVQDFVGREGYKLCRYASKLGKK
jgi:hypothetical protein